MRAELWPLDAMPREILEGWRDLAGRAMEPNPFVEPEFAMAAARHLPDMGRPLLLAVVEGGVVRACVPVAPVARWRRTRRPALAVWRHDYCFLGTPLIDSADPEPAIATLLRAGTADHRLFVLEWLHDGGPVAAAVRQVASTIGAHPVRYEHFERAALDRTASTPGLRVSGDRRRRLSRLARRLGEALGGEVQFVRDRGSHTLVERFLALENASWKGQAGTALARRSGHAAFFRELCRSYAEAGRLELATLEVAGQVAAVLCSVRAGDGLFLFKVAYDQALARYSPGTQLVIDVANHSGAAWIDSGAAPDQSWLNDLFPDRRSIATLFIAAPGWSNQVFASAVHAFVEVRDARRRRTSGSSFAGLRQLRPSAPWAHGADNDVKSPSHHEHA